MVEFMVPVRSKEIFPKPTQSSAPSPCPGHKKNPLLAAPELKKC